MAGVTNCLSGITLHGNTDPVILEEAWRAKFNRSPTDEEARAVLKEYTSCLEKELATPNAMMLIPNVKEALTRIIEKGFGVGLATGNIETGARIKLEAVGLWDFFKFGGYGSDSHDRAELIQIAIERARARMYCDFPEVWVVGDTPKDIEGAHRAGVKAIGVATGTYSVESLKKAGAEIVYPTLKTFHP